MKTGNLMPKWARVSIAVVALASVPATVLAELYDEFFSIDKLGVIGNSWVSSSSSIGSYLGLLVVGNGNYYDVETSGNSMIVGESCNIYDNNSVVIGKWNADTGGDEAFVIGNGNYTTPSNSLVVLKDGTVRIAPQGDVEMGIYGE